jgi:hypothetical protein
MRRLLFNPTTLIQELSLDANMLRKYRLDGEELDSLDLKAMIVTRGVKVSNEIYEIFGKTHRIYPDPLACNCLILPDGTVVQLTDVALHLRHLKSTMSLNSLRSFRSFLQAPSPFRLEVSDSGRPIISYYGTKITEVEFPPASHFYEQVTSNGLPYIGNAVLQGLDVLSFQCLWACDYARAGYACQFCYSGGVFEQLARKNKPNPPVPTTRDVAEITDYAINKEKAAKYLQLTGGSTTNPQAECGIIKDYLDEIDSVVGLKNIRGEVLVYTTPPIDPKLVDQLFERGANRVACSLEVWDEELAKSITPGKMKFAGRRRYLDCLKYISEEYGPNKACSSFVVGIEPLESFLKGAEYLATEGIVAIASIWIPFGRSVMGKVQTPGLDYYRKVKQGLADIYVKYGIEPPGGIGFNVCLCRDTWNHKSEIIGGHSQENCRGPTPAH